LILSFSSDDPASGILGIVLLLLPPQFRAWEVDKLAG